MLPDQTSACQAQYRKDQQYVTAWINVISITHEHAWYIAKMEGIVSVIVTAVDTASLSAL